MKTPRAEGAAAFSEVEEIYWREATCTTTTTSITTTSTVTSQASTWMMEAELELMTSSSRGSAANLRTFTGTPTWRGRSLAYSGVMTLGEGAEPSLQRCDDSRWKGGVWSTVVRGKGKELLPRYKLRVEYWRTTYVFSLVYPAIYLCIYMQMVTHVGFPCPFPSSATHALCNPPPPYPTSGSSTS